MKICTKCKIKKQITEFYKNPNVKCELSSWCKNCQKISMQNLHKKYPWKRTLHDIKARCENPKTNSYKYYGLKGIKNYLTIKNIKYLYKRDKAYNMIQPSIDRINSKKNYTLKNCRYIEKRINTELVQCRPIIQYNKNGKIIKEWKSIISASKSLKINYIKIIICLQNKFIWKYK